VPARGEAAAVASPTREANDPKEVTIVTRDIRLRIITLQVVLVLVLGFCAGFLFWGSGFVNGMVHDQLAAQKITFPAQDSAAIKALPAGDATAMKQYAGQQMTTGAQAETYANHFIAVHLQDVAGGQTYSQVSAAALANPTNAKLAAQVNTCSAVRRCGACCCMHTAGRRSRCTPSIRRSG
jgi:hypothetical protein